jgi:magnesium-transporting ATPase (P-type)
VQTNGFGRITHFFSSAINLFILFLMCVAVAVGYRFWTFEKQKLHVSYLPPASTSDTLKLDFDGFIVFWYVEYVSFGFLWHICINELISRLALIAFQNLVPVSLYLTVEIVKTVQVGHVYFKWCET